MYELHASDPDTYTVEKLAADYGLRYQRVMAILTLKKARAQLGSAALRFGALTPLPRRAEREGAGGQGVAADDEAV